MSLSFPWSCLPRNRPRPRHRLPRQQRKHLPQAEQQGRRQCQRNRLLSSTVLTHRHQPVVDAKAKSG